MKFSKNSITEIFKDLSEYFKSTDFSKAILLGIALTLPIIAGVKLEALQIGITITVGALLASPSDVSGSIRHKITATLFATLLAMVVSLIGGYLHLSLWLLFPVLGVLMFGISYISIYGFRASLISFSGLFALVLSFSNVSGGMEPYNRVLLIGLGGLWYVLLVLLWHYIFPKAPTEYYLSKTIKLTADYLKSRGELVAETTDRTTLLKKLLSIQTELTAIHETLRDILIESRTGSGKSDYEGKRLLIFVQLVDMLELAMANPVNYSKTDDFFKRKPEQLADFQGLLFAMSNRMNAIAANISNPKKLQKNNNIEEFQKKIKRDIAEYSSASNETFDESLLLLKNLFKYQKEQIRKIQKIEWLLKNPAQRDLSLLNKEDSRRFLTKQNYDFEVLVENFNMRSPIFKHSLRLAVMTMIGYGVGMMFSVQNPYWILLTLIVIMRPTFGLTKTRSKERTIGTLIGGALAVGIVLITQNTTVYGILAIVSLVIAFSMVQRNYKAAATFITLSVVFIYALLRPDIFNVIQYRVMDTLIGAGLATLGNLLLWPAWEIQGMQKTLLETLKANRLYLEEIIGYYNQKGIIPSKYKVARKKAFLEMSNLSAAFQRMTQEPKSKQKNLDKVYEITVLNHTFLSSLASLSTYILSNPTTPASKNFNKVSEKIVRNLSDAEAVLKEEIISENDGEIYESEDVFDATFGKNISFSEEEKSSKSEGFHSKIEEAHLVREQLKWLLAMSEKMPKLLRETKF
ncbi:MULTISPECIES: FUSC family protein [Aequorivita]|uniref:FUSC family protein n=1 Tax=Aequorivita iocasae TaxID=2803865 RepID=A0ABX7DV38_9FLAO|nr:MULTISPECIES: FUSC family membrane protein [Aequorivita]QQX77665.1 FUSC family protein [Aequorivita iocasae]UCA57163.1 FUSC family protein [Aequorivita sp. F7]